MRARLEQIIERYGQTVTLTPRNGDEVQEIRAFVQPVLKKNAEPPVAVTPLGPVCEQRWLYIGQAGTPVSAGDRVTLHEMRLAVQESKLVYWRDEALYQQAILRREREAAV